MIFFIVAALAALIPLVSGCGDNVSNELINVPPAISAMEAGESVLLVGEGTTISVKASDANGEHIAYNWSSNGGALSRVADDEYEFSTLVPGEFTVTVRVNDDDGFFDSESVVIKCYGDSDTEGAIGGTITVAAPAARPAAAGPSFSGNTLAAPVSILPADGRDPARRVVFESKGGGISACEADDFVPGEIMVKPAPGKSAARLASARGLKMIKHGPSGIALLGVNIAGLERDEAMSLTRRTCEELNREPELKFADLNGIRRAFSTPDDVYFDYQWHYKLINLPQAWNLETGSEDVVVAVVDSGIVSGHADLAGRLAAGYDFVTDLAGMGCDGDGIDPDPEDVSDSRCFYGPIPTDDYKFSGYHGTHVAGTIGAATDNGIGVAGIDRHAKIMPVRVLSIGGAMDYDIVQGLLYAVGLPNDSGTVPAVPAKIINISLGSEPGSGCPSAFADVFNSVYDAGAIAFVASGNNGYYAINPIALCDHVVAVGAVDRYGEVTPYSNGGTGLSVTAPGGDTSRSEEDGVLSTIRFDKTGNNTGYDFYQGTSMATPHAAGVAALMAAAYPAITPSQIAALMSQTAVDLGDEGTDTWYGAGLINAYSAVLEAKKLGQTVVEPRTPALSASQEELYFHYNEWYKNIILTNTGSGTLTLTSLSDTENSGGYWLGVTAGSDSKKIIISVSVNRDGLAGGEYSGSIDIVTNGGAARIAVGMEVDAPAVEPSPSCWYTTIYITVVSTSDYDVSVTSLPFSGGDYNMYKLDAGNHVIGAGTDCDGDGIIGEQAGVDFCGMYTQDGAMHYVTVEGKAIMKDADFTIEMSEDDCFTGGSQAPPGLKLLRRLP